MKKIYSYLIQYPIELLVVFVVAAGLMCFPSAISAALFVLTGMVLAYSLIYSIKKIIKLSSIILLFAIILIYYYLTQKELSGLSIILACVTSVAMAYFFGKANATNQNQKNAAKKMLIIGSILISLMPYIFNICFQISVNKDFNKLESEITGVNQTINDGIVSIKKQTEKYAGDEFITQLIQENQYEDLNDYSQNLMTSQGLDFLAIADANGKFIVRSDYPDLIGSDMEDIFPDLSVKTEINGVFHNDINIFAAYGKSIQVEGHTKPIGWILFGRNIDTMFLKNVINENDQVAMYYKGAVFPSPLKSVSSQVAGEAINTGLVNENNGKLLFDYDSKRYILLNNFIDCCTANLLLFREYKDDNISYIYGLVAVILLIFVINMIYMLLNKNEGVHKKASKFFKSFRRQDGFISFIYLVEFVLLSSIVLLVWHQSYKIFYKRSFDVNVVDKHEEINNIQLYNFSLKTDKFVKIGESSKIDIKISNYPIGNNSIQAEIHFSNEYLEAKEIVANDSICNKIHENTIDNNAGVLRFSCDMNYSESNAPKEQLLATVTFSAKAPGWSNIKIDDDYSYIVTDKGTLKSIYQSSSDGEKVLVY